MRKKTLCQRNVMSSVKGGLFLLLLFASSCAVIKGGEVRVQYPSEVTAEMERGFGRVEERYQLRQYDDAYAGYQHYIATTVYNRLTDEAYYKQGKIFFVTQRFDDAFKKFEELLNRSPNPAYRAKALHMMGYASYKMGDFKRAMTSFERVKPDFLPAKLQVQFYSLVILNHEQSPINPDFAAESLFRLFDVYEDYAEEGLRALHARDLIDDATARTKIESWVGASLTSIPAWMKAYPDGAARAYIDYKIGLIYYHNHQPKKARKAFFSFLKKYPKHRYAGAARKYLMELGETSEIAVVEEVHYKIGLILPLTGPLESYGQSVLNGVRCAVHENGACGPATGIELLIRDSGTTPAAVQAAVESLASEKVAAIVGPLSSSLAIEAGVVASHYRIPIFPITQTARLMEQGEYIFQIGLPPPEQIHALVKEAFSQGHRDFGVFYPDNAYGETMAGLFVAAVKNRGGKITAKVAYHAGAIDLHAEVRKLKSHLLASGPKGPGFDALFIPDSYHAINRMASALGYHGIEGIPLLGTNAWNDPDLDFGISKKFPGSFFVDLYDVADRAKVATDFQQGFISSFGHGPRVLEAYGYDAVMMIRETANKNGEGVMESLMRHQTFQGVTGIRGFEMGKGPLVEAKVLHVTEGGIEN